MLLFIEGFISSSEAVAGGSSTGGAVDVNLEEVPRLPSPHGNKASLCGWRCCPPYPPPSPPLNTHMGTDSVTVFRKKRPVLFQNPSELSDEELNDDLLQSDDEDVNMG